jgi:hypothetical protein
MLGFSRPARPATALVSKDTVPISKRCASRDATISDGEIWQTRGHNLGRRRKDGLTVSIKVTWAQGLGASESILDRITHQCTV